MQPDWEIWLDHNLSPILARWIAEETNIIVKSSYSLQSQFLSDYELYEKAKQNGRVILITKDSDLPELITQFGSPPKAIYLKIGNKRSLDLFNLIKPQLNKATRILIDSSIQIIEID